MAPIYDTPNGSGRVAFEPTSSSLLERLKTRDAKAWQQLADLYGPLVYYCCRRHGLKPEDAADVFQDVFLAVSAGIERYHHQRGSGTFRGWLWTITANKIRDHFRSAAGREEARGGTDAQRWIAGVPEHLADQPTDADGRSQLSGLFHRALDLVRAEFEDRTWEAFWRVTVERHDTREVAADLGISPNAVRQAKSRVLRRVRTILGDLGE